MAVEPGQIRQGRVVLVTLGALGGFVFLMWLFSLGDEPKDKAAGPVVPHRSVSKAEVSPWPFTVGSGVLRCRPASGAVTFQPDGMTLEYALNGSARAAGYPGPESFWAEDPQAPAGSKLRVSLSEIIAAGNAVC